MHLSCSPGVQDVNIHTCAYLGLPSVYLNASLFLLPLWLISPLISRSCYVFCVFLKSYSKLLGASWDNAHSSVVSWQNLEKQGRWSSRLSCPSPSWLCWLLWEDPSQLRWNHSLAVDLRLNKMGVGCFLEWECLFCAIVQLSKHSMDIVLYVRLKSGRKERSTLGLQGTHEKGSLCPQNMTNQESLL